MDEPGKIIMSRIDCGRNVRLYGVEFSRSRRFEADKAAVSDCNPTRLTRSPSGIVTDKDVIITLIALEQCGNKNSGGAQEQIFLSTC